MDRITSPLSQGSQRLRDLWETQNRTNQILFGGFGLALVLALIFFGVTRARGPEYGVLFANLSPDDASAVVTKLKDAKVPYRLSAGGTTVLVPQEVVYDERVALAGDGVVKGGGTGFELFDKTNFGMTDFQEKIAKQRATEGELQRTIAGLTPVESSRVHIATPESSLYSTTQLPTTASVAIKTKPGMQLGPSEVRGITQLVSRSVEGLKPENVTIVNQDGNILVPSPADAADGGGLAAQASALKLTQDQLVAKQRYEANLQENLQGLLDAAIGTHRSAVRVSSDMNFDANQSETKSYAPSGTVRSQQSEKESYLGNPPQRQAAVGVPGTTTNNLPTYQGTQNQQSAGRYNKSKNTVNYEVTEQNAKHIDAPGKVTRTSVAVLVNVPGAGTAPPPVNGQAAQAPVYTVAAADIAKIRNVVAAAAGIDPARGDQISVEAIPFAPLPETARGAGTSTVLGLPLPALVAVLAILTLGAVGFAVLGMRRRGMGGSFRPAMDLPSFDSSMAEELPSFEEHPMLDGSAGIAAPIRSAADLTREQMIEYVTTVAQENPDSIAKLVKLWLAE
ncbi:MAG: flagellar basal-body MS-ring/collar protein FliF [Candidatus Velthaea sp.]